MIWFMGVSSVSTRIFFEFCDVDSFLLLADAMFCSRKQPDAERAEELKELEELDRQREAEAEKKE